MQKAPYSPNPYSTYIPLSSIQSNYNEGSAVLSALSGLSMGNTLQIPLTSPSINLQNEESIMAPLGKNSSKIVPSPGFGTPRNRSGWIKSDDMGSFGTYTVNVQSVDSQSVKGATPFADRTNLSQNSNSLGIQKQESKAASPTNIHLSLTPTQAYLSPSLTPQSPKHINENSNPNFNKDSQKKSKLSRKVFAEKRIDYRPLQQNDSFSSLINHSRKPIEHTEAKILQIDKEISTLERYINQPGKEEETRTLRTYLCKLRNDRELLRGILTSRSTFKPISSNQ